MSIKNDTSFVSLYWCRLKVTQTGIFNLTHQHIEAWTKWHPFYRQHFQLNIIQGVLPKLVLNVSTDSRIFIINMLGLFCVFIMWAWQGFVLQTRREADPSLLANGSAAFISKLCCHQLKRFGSAWCLARQGRDLGHYAMCTWQHPRNGDIWIYACRQPTVVPWKYYTSKSLRGDLKLLQPDAKSNSSYRVRASLLIYTNIQRSLLF